MNCDSDASAPTGIVHDAYEPEKTWDRFWKDNVDDDFDCGCWTTSFLIPCLRARSVRNILCVGNGASREAHALTHAGFLVDVLDVSKEAGRLLREASMSTAQLDRILGGSQEGREGGRLAVFTGDFRTAFLCPGPYDLVVVRRVLQYSPAEDIPALLLALKARLAACGLLVLESQNVRNTRKTYIECLRKQDFAVAWDFEVQGKSVSAPRVLSITGKRSKAWVISSTG